MKLHFNAVLDDDYPANKWPSPSVPHPCQEDGCHKFFCGRVCAARRDEKDMEIFICLVELIRFNILSCLPLTPIADAAAAVAVWSGTTALYVGIRESVNFEDNLLLLSHADLYGSTEVDAVLAAAAQKVSTP